MNIGFFGGAFDPLHKEHIEIIKKAPHELNLDKLILVPTYAPPHKKGSEVPYELRRSMLFPYQSDTVEISDFEIESKKDFNCTFETLPNLKKLYPADKYFYIIGSDSMINFHTWIKPEKIVKEATLAVVVRHGFEENLKEAIERAKSLYGADIIVLTHEGKKLSSRELRARLMLKLDISEFIDENTADIINKNHLYNDYAEIIKKVKNELPDRFEHIANTVVTAMRLPAKIDFDKVFLSALLHDVGKYRKNVEGVPEKSKGTKVEHQFSGAIIAEKEYKIKDKEILSAIRFHTTAKANMTELEMLIYLADVIEPTRNFKGVSELRKLADNSIKQGFIYALKRTYDHLKAEGKAIYPLTLEAVEYYLKEQI